VFKPTPPNTSPVTGQAAASGGKDLGFFEPRRRGKERDEGDACGEYRLLSSFGQCGAGTEEPEGSASCLIMAPEAILAY